VTNKNADVNMGRGKRPTVNSNDVDRMMYGKARENNMEWGINVWSNHCMNHMNVMLLKNLSTKGLNPSFVRNLVSLGCGMESCYWLNFIWCSSPLAFGLLLYTSICNCMYVWNSFLLRCSTKHSLRWRLERKAYECLICVCDKNMSSSLLLSFASLPHSLWSNY